MARHAGFAIAATITEDTANAVLDTYVKQQLGPFLFPLPKTITALGQTVTFGGIVEVLPPSIECHVNAGNLIRLHVTLQSELRAQVGMQPMRTWTVQWSATVDVPLVTTIVSERLVIGTNTKQIVFQPFTVTELKGRILPPPALAALQSPAFAAAATAFVQSLPLLPLSMPLLRTQIDVKQPGYFKDSGFSVFDWFELHLSASRVVVRPLEQALAIGVDFAGFTSGDPGQLIDLTKYAGGGTLYYTMVTQTTDPNATPILARASEPATGNIAIAVNIGFVAGVVGKVSSQIGGTPVTKQVILRSIAFGYSTFDKPLRGKEDGMCLSFHVWLKAPGNIITEADGRFYLQPYLKTYDGPTHFIKPDTWQIYVPPAEIDLPWWVDVALFVLTTVFSIAVPVLSPILAIGLIFLLDGVIPGLLANVGAQASKGLSSAANSISFPPAWSAPLPGLTKPNWDGFIRYVSVTPDTLDMATANYIAWNERTDPPVASIGIHTYPPIAPDEYPVEMTDAIPLGIALRNDWKSLLAGKNLMLQWEIRRNDTGQVVLQTTNPYFVVWGSDWSDGPLLDHHTPSLYTVTSFSVRCVGTLTLDSQVGQVFTATQTINILDNIDRSRKYVHWGPHRVYFKNAGTDNKFWSHVRFSRVHRTAVAARCRMLRRVAAIPERRKLFRYFDALPVHWTNLDQHRKPLCEFCFFGSPHRHDPLPDEDWFVKEAKI